MLDGDKQQRLSWPTAQENLQADLPRSCHLERRKSSKVAIKIAVDIVGRSARSLRAVRAMSDARDDDLVFWAKFCRGEVAGFEEA